MSEAALRRARATPESLSHSSTRTANPSTGCAGPAVVLDPEATSARGFGLIMVAARDELLRHPGEFGEERARILIHAFIVQARTPQAVATLAEDHLLDLAYRGCWELVPRYEQVRPLIAPAR